MRRNSSIRSGCLAAICVLVCLAVEASAADTPTTPKKPASSTSKPGTKTSAKKKHARSKAKPRSSKKRGQKAIDAERTQQIQEALIREHYLSGKPSGKWDDATQSALRRYQAEQGWQSKTVPDSRALIKLGLGPSHDHLLNPETAMTSVGPDHNAPPKRSGTNPPAQAAPSSDATPQN